MSAEARGLRVFIVVGEHSGDQLGFKLMRALKEATNGRIAFVGIGGEAMAAEGLNSLFPLSDIAVMGIAPVIARIRESAAADGTGFKGPQPSELDDRAWRADPSDGMRPLKSVRATWNPAA